MSKKARDWQVHKSAQGIYADKVLKRGHAFQTVTTMKYKGPAAAALRALAQAIDDADKEYVQ